jgi:hypothetical protein
VALIRPNVTEATFKKSPYGRTAASQQRARELLNPPKPPEPKKDEKTAEGYPLGVGRDSPSPDALSKRAAWQQTPLTSNKIVIDGYTINFTPDALIISKGGKVLWKKDGDYSRPTNSTLTSAKKLVTGLSRQGQPDEKQMFGKVDSAQLQARREHKKKWSQAADLSTNKKISFQQAWQELFGNEVDEAMMPASNFAGTPKHKLGSAAHLKGKMKRPARAGDLVGGGAEESVQHGIKVSEGVENIMDSLINKIIANEAIQNNK